MPKGEELRFVPPQNVSSIALGLEVQEVLSPSSRGRSVSLDIPLYRTGHLVAYPNGPPSRITYSMWTYRQVLLQATMFRVTEERWAQIGIMTEFLIVVRTLGEFFRLRHVHGTNFSTAVAALYVGGALIAACSCWAGVTFYFFRRYMLSAWITLAIVPILLVYKMAVIGW
jgi:hypothetical protein